MRYRHYRASRRSGHSRFRRLIYEALEDRRMLTGSPFTGKTGDIVAIDLARAIPDGRDFELIGIDLVDQGEAGSTALRLDVSAQSGDLTLKAGDGKLAGYVVFSDRTDEDLALLATSGRMYVAPGTIAGLPYDRDVTEVGFQGELRVWARAGEPLFPVVADVAGIESGLNAGVISAALRARFQELDVPLSSAHVTVGSRTIGKPGDSIYTSSWLVVDGASDAAYSIVPRDGILVVSEAHAVDVQIVGGYSTEGADAVPASARSVVDVMRQQQRLRYLGYPGQSGPLRVDGVMSGDTQRAIGLFCAAVTGGEPVLRDEFTAEGAAFINAVNAPR